MEAGSTPADSSRSASSRAPRPASMRIRTPSPSTRVALPELPEPRTRKRMARGNDTRERGLSDPEPGRLRAVAAEVAEEAHGHLTPEQVGGDARDVPVAHRL